MKQVQVKDQKYEEKKLQHIFFSNEGTLATFKTHETKYFYHQLG
jgi:YHS domain-containing protein